MKAAWLERYGKGEVRQTVGERAAPRLGAKDVLLRVSVAGVNPLDNMIAHGEVKVLVPYKTPLVMGNECVGVVEKIGPSVTMFKQGDRVYARLPLNRIGAFAEYVAVDEAALALTPDYLSDEEAAAIPLTALTAMQALDLMRAEPGKTIFISGGTGSFGAMAIPLAKARGLTVITNGSGKNAGRVMELGADRFIDYRKEDYATALSDVDYVIDSLGGAELEKQFSILKRGGKLVSLRGGPNKAFAQRIGASPIMRLVFGFVNRKYDAMAARNGQTYDFIFVHSDGRQLAEASEILAGLEVHPSVDGVYVLEDVNAALQKVAGGGSRGKTVIQIQ
ncbi:MAG: NADP-dependent oxidoreductase [Oscillibacter sp.]|nr:NADP-dependent oxidoreductase [Oscillibacter sp.]